VPELWTLGLNIAHAMNSQPLSEFSLIPGEYGWSGLFPDSHRFFGQQIGLEIHTRLTPREPKVLPPVSANQAGLVRKIAAELPTLIPRLEQEFTTYNQKFDPDFQGFITHPHVWLSDKSEDGASWAFVVERTDNPDFGYHAEFRNVEFIELWAGD